MVVVSCLVFIHHIPLVVCHSWRIPSSYQRDNGVFSGVENIGAQEVGGLHSRGVYSS